MCGEDVMCAGTVKVRADIQALQLEQMLVNSRMSPSLSRSIISREGYGQGSPALLMGTQLVVFEHLDFE